MTAHIRCPYPDGGGSRHPLKAHVWQINELIVDEGYQIEGHGSFYRLVNMRKRAMKTWMIAGAKCRPESLGGLNPERVRQEADE